MAGARRYRTVGFHDESIVGGMQEKREKYSGVVGRRDIVRFLTPPVAYYGARVESKDDPDKGFFAISHADPDDCKAAQDGDAAALKRCQQACPLWKDGFEVVERVVCLIWWVGSFDRKERYTKVGKAIPFAFAGEKYQALRQLWQTAPRHKSTGKPLPPHLLEVSISTTDAKYQKQTFAINHDRKSKWEEIKAAVAELFENPDDLGSPCSMIDEFVEAEPIPKLRQSIDRMLKRGRFKDDSDEFGGDGEGDGEAPRRRARREEPDELDYDDVDAEAEAEDEEPAPPPRKKPAAKPKPAAGGKAGKGGQRKPAPAASEEESDEDLGDDLDDLDAALEEDEE